MLLAGVPIMDDDGRNLVDLLMRNGRADDVMAAAAIHKALSTSSALVVLSRDERRAILGALFDPPEGLVELRGVLLRELGIEPTPPQ